MLKLFTILLALLISTTAFGQTTKKAEDWQTFSPTSDEFSVETPVKLELLSSKERRSRHFFGTISGVYLYVFSDPLQSKAYYSMVREILPKLGHSGNGLPVDGSGANAISFKDVFGYWHNLTTLRTPTRVYVAQTVALDENSELASRFIRSFGRGERPLFTSEQPDPDPKPEVSPIALSTSKGETTAQRSGTVYGSGSGSGTGSGSPAAAAPDQTSALRILSKPSPGYTDLARIYNVQGTVIVRAMFLSSGKIGSVTTVTQLPFGLTSQAVEAARRLTFVPAYRDGVAVNVSKQIEYSFSLF